jgi:hypothetical protein
MCDLFLLQCFGVEKNLWRSDWISVYGTVAPSLAIPKGRYNERHSFNGGNIYVFGCDFFECYSSAFGGAILISTSSSTKLLVEASMFTSCRTSGNGGAMYCSFNGNSVLSQVCGLFCSSSNDEGFAEIDCNNNQGMNEIKSSSICYSYCPDFNTIDNRNSVIVYSDVNNSHNECEYNACCYVWPSPSTVCLFSFSSFINSTANGYRNICLDYDDSNKTIKMCNVIKNKQVSASTSDGIIKLYGYCEIISTCILENSATYTIWGSSSSNIVLQSCSLNNDISSKINKEMKIISPIGPNVNNLIHLSTGGCIAHYICVEKSPKCKCTVFCVRRASAKTLRFL